jgi:hypothetical protein
MTYWRMQLHPSQSNQAVKHAVESLAAGYIGLDFEGETGDISIVAKSLLPRNQRDYWAFANEMAVDDHVLIIAHHFPFALVRVSGPYNYIKLTVPEIGVWFSHFRAVDDIRYFADFRTNARAWRQITMTDTISPLRAASSLSYRLIEEWLAAASDT